MPETSPPENTLRDEALRWVARGFAVFPVCWPGHGKIKGHGEHPLDKQGKAPLTLHGVSDATMDEPTIKAWFEKYPKANYGIRLGERYAVLDFDTTDGYQSFHEEDPDVLSTLVVRSGRTDCVGVHVYLEKPEDLKLPGLHPWGGEIKTGNAYVVGPGSLHLSGRRYEFIADVAIAMLPTWVRERLEQKAVDGKPKPRLDPADILAGVPEGQRDEKIFRYACSLRARNVPRAEADALILAAARAALPPFPDDEALKKVERAYETYETDPLVGLELTHIGLGKLLIRLHGDQLRYAGDQKTWYVWDTKRWAEGLTVEVDRLAKETVEALFTLARGEPEENRRNEIRAWALRSSAVPQWRSAIVSASSEPEIRISSKDFDENEMLFNVANGTLDLRSGTLRPYDPRDLITMASSVAFDPDATCPVWEDDFLLYIMNGSKPLVRFLQRAVGYSLTGSTEAQAMFTLYGVGQNGKSQFMKVLRQLFGDYYAAINSRTIASKRGHSDGNPASSDVDRLRGKRLAASIEAGRGMRLDEEIIKRFTGEDDIVSRGMYKSENQWLASLKLWLAVNHLPRIVGTDLAVWRRQRVIPFEVIIPPEKRINKFAERFLYPELPGILNWALAGCCHWQAEGELTVPEEVNAATIHYKEEQDTVGRFIAQCCETGGDELEVDWRLLNKAYGSWCKDTKTTQFNEREFGAILREKGFKASRRPGGVATRLGISLKSGSGEM